MKYIRLFILLFLVINQTYGQIKFTNHCYNFNGDSNCYQEGNLEKARSYSSYVGLLTLYLEIGNEIKTNPKATPINISKTFIAQFNKKGVNKYPTKIAVFYKKSKKDQGTRVHIFFNGKLFHSEGGYNLFRANEVIKSSNTITSLYHYEYGDYLNKGLTKEVLDLIEKNTADSNYELFQIYRRGKGVVKIDFKKSREYLFNAVAKGSKEGYYELGWKYLLGSKAFNITKNINKGANYLEIANQKGHPLDNSSKEWIGRSYALNNDGITAIKWLKEPAKEGDKDAQFLLGVILTGYDDVKSNENYKKGVDWLRISCKAGKKKACSLMKSMVEKDVQRLEKKSNN